MIFYRECVYVLSFVGKFVLYWRYRYYIFFLDHNFPPDPTPVNRIDVNDTITGDPVLTVPILVPEDQLQQIDADQLSLCYEVHGDTDTWFNLVSDKCASVNAHYEGIAERLNVIDVIGIRTTDNFGNCVNISVSLQDSCSPVINGTAVSRYSVGGVRVRTMANRVRISLPNCNDVALVMWVICESREFKVELNDVETEVIGDVIKYVITRGLNYGRLAHGLLGMTSLISKKVHLGQKIRRIFQECGT